MILVVVTTRKGGTAQITYLIYNCRWKWGMIELDLSGALRSWTVRQHVGPGLLKGCWSQQVLFVCENFHGDKPPKTGNILHLKMAVPLGKEIPPSKNPSIFGGPCDSSGVYMFLFKACQRCFRYQILFCSGFHYCTGFLAHHGPCKNARLLLIKGYST